MEKKKLNKTTKSNLITYGMVLAAYLIVQGMIAGNLLSNLMQGLLVPLCVYIILALSLNLTVGILGELSLGHAGFMCIGAFTSAAFTKATMDTFTNAGLRFFVALIIGAVCAGIFGFLIGIPVLRLKGDYLAIVTLAFGEIIKNIINVLYVGIDSNGIHFSMKDQMSLGMEPGGNDHQWCHGYHRYTETVNLYYRCDSDPGYFIRSSEPDQFQRRTCDHGNP